MSNSEIISKIEANMHRDDFANYMDFCVKKWQKLDTELQVIDTIISSICREWKISKGQLIEDKRFVDARAIMFYIIKKQMNMTYSEIAIMFNKGKGHIHKMVDDISFVIEKQSQKELCVKFDSISRNLTLQV